MGTERFRKPIMAVDVALFTFNEGELKVLLVRRDLEPFAGKWALVGGLLDPANKAHSSFEEVARLSLLAKTGVDAPYMEQLRTYGNRERSPRGWEGTVGYLALMPPERIDFDRMGKDTNLKWAVVHKEGVRVSLEAFDHKTILRDAIHRLRAKFEYSPIGAYLLGEEFTLAELRNIYEAVLETAFSARGFTHQVEKAGILEEIKGRTKSGAFRPAQLYRLKAWEGEMRSFFPRQISRRREE